MLDVAKIGPIPKFQGLALGGNKIEKKRVLLRTLEWEAMSTRCPAMSKLSFISVTKISSHRRHTAQNDAVNH